VTIEFLASFPPIQSAIKVGQDGMRLQLDVPESEMGNALGILAWRGKLLRIRIESAECENG
jgi:hypothetical protein